MFDQDGRIAHAFICAAQEIAFENTRPSTIYKPVLFLDGEKWCALYGENLQDGVCGFGDSPAEAMKNFDKNWNSILGRK